MSGGRRLAGLPPLARPPACASALLRGPPSLGRAAASSLPSAPARPRAGRSPWGSRAVLASSWGGLGVGGAGASGFRGVGLGPFRPPAPPIAAAGVRWRKESERQGPTVGGRGGVGSRASRPVPGRVASRWLGGVKRARRSPPPTGLRRSISPPRLLVSPPPRSGVASRPRGTGDGWRRSARPPSPSGSVVAPPAPARWPGPCRGRAAAPSVAGPVPRLSPPSLPARGLPAPAAARGTPRRPSADASALRRWGLVGGRSRFFRLPPSPRGPSLACVPRARPRCLPRDRWGSAGSCSRLDRPLSSPPPPLALPVGVRLFVRARLARAPALRSRDLRSDVATR